MDTVKKWTLSNGNKCFQFCERQEFERPWIIFLVGFLLIAGTSIEYLAKNSYYSLIPNFIFFFFAFLWWITIPLKANEAIIEKNIHEIMDDLVEKDATAVGTHVVRSIVYYDIKGTYGIITGRYFLVLLKNGKIWEYPIKYHTSTDGKCGYYECNKKHVVSNDKNHIRAIRPKEWRNFLAKINLSDKTKLWFLIFLIILVGGLIFAGTFWAVIKLKWWTFILLGGYFFLYETTKWIAKIRPKNFVNTIKRVVSLPLIIICIFVSLVQPFITIVGTFFFIFLFTFLVPAIIMTIFLKTGCLQLKSETIVFVVFALGSILTSNYSVTKNIIRHTPLKNWGNHTYESHRENLAFYLAHPSNMTFLMYFIYFVYLTISGYQFIQNEGYIISNEFDMSILKAFLVYIAFTNMRTKAKETEIKEKELLQRIAGLFEHDKYEY